MGAGRAGRLHHPRRTPTTVTGFAASIRSVIVEREGGRCARCGNTYPTHLHHRRPRGAGGSRRASTNTAANGLHLCWCCHQFIEEHRDQALRHGWLVAQTDDPATVPVLYRGQWMNIDADGFLNPTPM